MGICIKSSYDYAIEQLSLKNNENANIVTKESLLLKYVPKLLQKDYGEDNDCTITSITTVISYLIQEVDYEKVYSIVVNNINPKWAYSWYGTIPIFISRVINNILKSLSYTDKKCRGLYFKDIGVTNESIKKWLNSTNLPLILSVYKANEGYYESHSTTVVGYIEYLEKNTNNILNLIAIHDNWSKKVRYIDYNKLHKICMINYIE